MNRAIQWATFGLALVSLGGCLGKMESSTDEMKTTVKATNDLLQSLKNETEYGMSIQIMDDSTRSPSVRAAAARAVIINGPEDQIYLLLGVPALLKLDTTDINYGAKTVHIPNVTLVGAHPYKEYGFNPVKKDLYEILCSSTIQLLKDIGKAVDVPGISPDDLELLKKATSRLVIAAPAILGGVAVDELFERLSSDSTRRPFAVPLAERWNAAKDLAKAVHALVPEKEKDLELNLNARMDIQTPN